MKNIAHALLASFAVTLTASASSTLLIETTIAEQRAAGKEVLAAPRLTVESGQQAVIRVDKFEYAVTPTLTADGAVDIRAVLIRHDGDKAETLARPQVMVALDKTAEIQAGRFSFTMKTSLAK